VSLTKREDRRLATVFENGMLRTIFRPKREEVTGSWRKFHNEELHNLYSSPNIRNAWETALLGKKIKA
jgi:hypothetical protein